MSLDHIQHEGVRAAYASYPSDVQKRCMLIRQLLLDTAKLLPNVGQIEETLKWGEPSYLTSNSKSGSTIRIAWKKSKPQDVGIYFNCKTTLVRDIRSIYGDEFSYDGNRALYLPLAKPMPTKMLAHCLEKALCYHLTK